MAKTREYIIDMNAVQLVEYLNWAYPARCIAPTMTLEQAHREGGRRDLIDTLMQRIKNEEEKYAIATQRTV